MIAQKSIFSRFIEGMTVFFMSAGFLYGGGHVFSSCFFLYMCHAIVSLVYHLHPCPTIYWFDTSLANLLLMERSYYKTKNLWVYIPSIFMEPASQSWVLLQSIAMIFMGGITFSYLYQWMVCCFFYYGVLHYMLVGKKNMSTTACVFFHVGLGVLSCMEVGLYTEEQEMVWKRFVRYLIYNLYVFYTVYATTDNPRRLRSVLSLFSAVVLAPLSFYQVWCQLSYDGVYTDESQTGILVFYLAYVVADTMLGCLYYRRYFTLLEGWVHHMGTGLTTLYYMDQTKTLYCMCMVIETSTILLSLFKIFYDVPWILYLRDKWFDKIFVLFRIIMPTFFMLYFYHLLVDTIAIIIYLVNMTLNLYWICKITRKNNHHNKNVVGWLQDTERNLCGTHHN